MLLFNRFQLSKRNGWMNEDGEVFVIYTRGELAGKLHIGEKRVTSAMNELRDFRLIWERRCEPDLSCAGADIGAGRVGVNWWTDGCVAGGTRRINAARGTGGIKNRRNDGS